MDETRDHEWDDWVEAESRPVWRLGNVLVAGMHFYIYARTEADAGVCNLIHSMIKIRELGYPITQQLRHEP